MNTVINTFETPNGKEIQIKRRDTGQLIIDFATGGERPKEFEGFYTKEIYAEQVIRKYLQKKTKEAVKKQTKEKKEK